MTSLTHTEEYFDNLRVLVVNCDRPVLDEIDEEMLNELKQERDELERHMRSLKRAAKSLNWESDEELENYLEEMEEAGETLDTGLSRIDPKQGVNEQLANELQEAVNTLYNCTAGLMEDI